MSEVIDFLLFKSIKLIFSYWVHSREKDLLFYFKRTYCSLKKWAVKNLYQPLKAYWIFFLFLCVRILIIILFSQCRSFEFQ